MLVRSDISVECLYAGRASANEAALRAADTAQPALGAVSLGAWRVLESFGVRADAFAGHSYGELVALSAAGRFRPLISLFCRWNAAGSWRPLPTARRVECSRCKPRPRQSAKS